MLPEISFSADWGTTSTFFGVVRCVLYVLHVDLSDIRELVSLQRRCANNLNQVAIQANTYGGIYPEEIAQLQKDYAALWEPLSDLLKKLSAVTEL